MPYLLLLGRYPTHEWPRADDRRLPIVARSAVDAGGRAGKPFRDIEPAVLDPPSPCARKPSVMPKGVVWTKPMLAAETAFRAWTHDVKLRHASFKGLRERADEVAIYRLG